MTLPCIWTYSILRKTGAKIIFSVGWDPSTEGLSHGRSVRTSYFAIALDAILCSLSRLIHTQLTVSRDSGGHRRGEIRQFRNQNHRKFALNLRKFSAMSFPTNYDILFVWFGEFCAKIEPVGVCVGKEAERRSFKKGDKNRAASASRVFPHLDTSRHFL